MEYDLQKFQLFKGVDKRSLTKLSEKMVIRNFKKGDFVIEENTIGNELYVLLKGEVTILKALTLNTSPDTGNKNKALIHLKSEWYPFFGEFAMIEENAKRTASVVASKDCTMGIFTREDLMTYMSEHPKCGYYIFQNIARVLGDRLKNTNRDILKLTTALMLILEG
jgi:CRP-like cAMP-binding protein